MDNENKEFDLETSEMKPDSAELEFDPSDSEDFYNNLEAALGVEGDSDFSDIPELLIEEEPFGGIESIRQEDALFEGVDAALSEQIEQEFGKEEIGSTEEEKTNKFLMFWTKIPKWTKILVSVILAVLISVGLLFGTTGGRKLVYKMIVGIVFDPIPVDPDSQVSGTPVPEQTITETPIVINPTETPAGTNPDETPTVVPEATPTESPVSKLKDDENIINVMLFGEEALESYGSRGRTDAIVLVSVNLEGGPLKMVSFQRDLYVGIPGHSDGRINSAYQKGGAKLAVETIEQNFGIDIDSYVKVDFEGFEHIIDLLGGLRISLTARESNYLNTTEYISKPEQRNTIAGYQNMTGAQVLGYCRVRFVPTAEGITNDIGRNYRHRVVLKAIFDQCKNKNLGELISIMGQCFKYVSVDANLEQLASDCLMAVIENKMFDIETLQMPKNGASKNATINGAAVVLFTPEDVDLLQNFLYGEEE